jgi:Family of unknown function (DUF6461)
MMAGARSSTYPLRGTMLGMVDTSRHSWAEECEALSLTLVKGVDDEVIMTQLELTGHDQTPRTFDQAWGQIQNDGVFVQLAHIDGWTAIIEDNGYFASLPEHLGPLSSGGAAVNVYWNVNGVSTFGYGVAGQIVRHFDPSGVDSNEGTPLPEESDLDFDDEDSDYIGLALLLMERLSGVTIDGDWVLNQPRRIFTERL